MDINNKEEYKYDILEILHYFDYAKPKGTSGYNPTLGYFKKVNFVGDISAWESYTNGEKDFIMTDVTPEDTDILNYTMMTRSHDPTCHDYQLKKVKPLTRKEARGICDGFSNKTYEITLGGIDKNNTFIAQKRYIQYHNGRYRFGDKKIWDNKNCDDEFLFQLADYIGFAVFFQLMSDYVWKVFVSSKNGIKFGFTCDFDGAKAIFEDRDKKDGNLRKSPIRNWVKDHYRKKRKTKDFTYISKHLRGVTRFKWCGYDVEIHPSKEDLSKIQ